MGPLKYLSPYHIGSDFSPGQSMWDLRWINLYFSKAFQVSRVTIPQMLHIHISTIDHSIQEAQ